MEGTTMAATIELDPINRILKMLRIADELSARELGSQINLSISYISDIETGRKKPTLVVLEKYGQYFGISPANLLLLQEGNEHASNTELLFKVLERRLAAMELEKAPAETETVKPVRPMKQGQKRTKQQPRVTQREELATAV
jgi:transcriptional regulator with XRE-family HTH domain